MKKLFVILLGIGFVVSSHVQAAEVSLLSGIYQQEKGKSDGDSTGGKSTISFGGRYGDDYDQGMIWFGQGNLTLRSFDEAKGGKSPSNSTSLALGGGLRMYFDPFAQGITPFMYGMGQYVSDKDGTIQGQGYSETETNGLFYSMAVGFRFGLDGMIFLDLESPLFVSSLTSTSKTETVTPDGAGGTNKVKSETSRTDLFVDTSEAFNSVIISLGMKI